VGRGFYSVDLFQQENGTWIFTCYVKVRIIKQGFSSRETQEKLQSSFSKKPQSGFFHGMEAAAKNYR